MTRFRGRTRRSRCACRLTATHLRNLVAFFWAWSLVFALVFGRTGGLCVSLRSRTGRAPYAVRRPSTRGRRTAVHACRHRGGYRLGSTHQHDQPRSRPLPRRRPARDLSSVSARSARGRAPRGPAPAHHRALTGPATTTRLRETFRTHQQPASYASSLPRTRPTVANAVSTPATSRASTSGHATTANPSARCSVAGHAWPWTRSRHPLQQLDSWDEPGAQFTSKANTSGLRVGPAPKPSCREHATPDSSRR